MAAQLLDDQALVDAVLEDHRSAPISDAHKALFTLIEKAALFTNEVTAGDIAAVKAAGMSEEAIYDAITVCALFKFFTTWVDASGVADLGAEGYAMSGERLAAHGYAPAE